MPALLWLIELRLLKLQRRLEGNLQKQLRERRSPAHLMMKHKVNQDNCVTDWKMHLCRKGGG
jgi:hypothetical protein